MIDAAWTSGRTAVLRQRHDIRLRLCPTSDARPTAAPSREPASAARLGEPPAGLTGHGERLRPDVVVPCARRAPGPDRLAVRRCLSDCR